MSEKPKPAKKLRRPRSKRTRRLSALACNLVVFLSGTGAEHKSRCNCRACIAFREAAILHDALIGDE